MINKEIVVLILQYSHLTLNVSHFLLHDPINLNLLPFLRVIIKQLLNQINMSQNHPPATVTFEAELVHGVAFVHGGGEEGEVGFPFVADYFAAGEATDGDDHWIRVLVFKEDGGWEGCERDRR